MTEIGPVPRRRVRQAVAILAITALLGSCDDGSSPPPLAGGSSEQGNALAVELRDSSGMPVGNARIRVRPGSWTSDLPLVAGTFADVLADSRGRALVPDLQAGAYVVEALRDSLVGASAILELAGDTVPALLLLERGSSLTMGSSDPSVTGFALRGLDRTGVPAGAGRYRFHHLPRTTLRIETRFPDRTKVHALPPLEPGTRAEVLVVGDTLQVVSGTLEGISIPAVSGDLFASSTIDLVPSGVAATPQRRLDDGGWVPSPSSLRLDSTFGGEFRLTDGSWSSAPARLRWNLWNGQPREIFDFAADDSDTTGFPPPTLVGGLRLVDSSGPFVRLDSNQSIEWGLALMDSIPEGALELRFRPGPGFRRTHAYSLVSNEASRLGIGFLKGMLYFVKGTDFLHRWVTSPPGQLDEDRWYRILATWGPQGMTLSVDGNLVGWSSEISGYSPGTGSVSQLALKSGAKDSCCLEVLGIVSPQRLDGDISSIHLYAQQPIVFGSGLPRACPDSVAGDLRARCGSSSTPRDFEILH